MSRHRVTECQTARNSQLMLLASCGCGTQGDPGCFLTTCCSRIIQAWYYPPGRELRALSSWWYRWEQSSQTLCSLPMLTQLQVRSVISRGLFCHSRTQGTVNIYSVAGQSEDQSHFSLILLWHSHETAQVSPGSTALIKGVIAVSPMQR